VLRCVAVCCSVLQCVAVCCSVLQCVAVCCSALQFVAVNNRRCDGAWDRFHSCVAVCCSVLQCVAVCCSVLHCIAVCSNLLRFAAVNDRCDVSCNRFRFCVAACCSMFHCVAVCCHPSPSPPQSICLLSLALPVCNPVSVFLSWRLACAFKLSPWVVRSHTVPHTHHYHRYVYYSHKKSYTFYYLHKKIDSRFFLSNSLDHACDVRGAPHGGCHSGHYAVKVLTSHQIFPEPLSVKRNTREYPWCRGLHESSYLFSDLLTSKSKS